MADVLLGKIYCAYVYLCVFLLWCLFLWVICYWKYCGSGALLLSVCPESAIKDSRVSQTAVLYSPN